MRRGALLGAVTGNERAEPVGEVESPDGTRESVRRANVSEYLLYSSSAALCERLGGAGVVVNGIAGTEAEAVSDVSLVSLIVEYTPPERCELATKLLYARPMPSWPPDGDDLSDGAANEYTLARHACEPSVHPGIGLRSVVRAYDAVQSNALRFGGSGHSAALMRCAAIITPDW